MLVFVPSDKTQEIYKDAYSEETRRMNENYHEAARMKVRTGFQLFAARTLMQRIQAGYDHPDQAVSDPRFYELKDMITRLEKEMD